MMTRFVTVERQVLTRSFPIVLEVHRHFNLHEFDRMDIYLDPFREEIIQEFYDSFVNTILGYIVSRSRPDK